MVGEHEVPFGLATLATGHRGFPWKNRVAKAIFHRYVNSNTLTQNDNPVNVMWKAIFHRKTINLLR